MALDPRISLGVQTPDVSGALRNFMGALDFAQRREQQNALAPLQLQQAQQQAQLGAIELQNARDAHRLANTAIAAQEIKPLLQTAIETGDDTQVKTFLTRRIANLQKRAAEGETIDATESIEALEMVNQGQIQGLLDASNNLISIAGQVGLGGVKPERVTASKILEDGTTIQSLSGGGTKVIDSAGNEITGVARSKAINTALEKQVEQRANIKGGEKSAAGISDRVQGFIDSGIDAADSVNNLRRSIDLLNTVETGGFNNAALAVKRFFGVEGADEAELSANLGRSVLAQLKPIFGAAFTAAEVERLEKIEVSFGASTEANKRLLEQVLKTTEEAAKRGLRAAQKAGDEFTASEIQRVLDSFETIQTPQVDQPTTNLNSPVLDRSVTEQDIQDTLNANPGLTRDQLLQQLGIK